MRSPRTILNHPGSRLVVFALAAAAALGLAPILQQDSPAPSTPPADQSRLAEHTEVPHQAVLDRPAVRAMLERRLRDAQMREQRLSRALAAHDAGQTIDAETMRSLVGNAAANNAQRAQQPTERPNTREQPKEQSKDGRSAANRPPTTEERAAIREILAKSWPDLATALGTLEKADAKLAETRYTQLFGRMHSLIELRMNDLPAFQAKIDEMAAAREAAMLARKIALAEQSAGDSDETRADRDRLLALVGIQFECRRTLRLREIAALESRIDQANSAIDLMDAGKDRIVRDQVERSLARERKNLKKSKDASSPAPAEKEEPTSPAPSQAPDA